MATPAKLELTIKFSTLPDVTTTPPNGWKSFTLDCDGQRVKVTVRPKLWTKLETAASTWPQWVAAVAGKMGPRSPEGFELLEPSIQVFERKPRPPGDTSAPPGEGAPTPGQ
jgi:hypothetical protein